MDLVHRVTSSPFSGLFSVISPLEQEVFNVDDDSVFVHDMCITHYQLFDLRTLEGEDFFDRKNYELSVDDDTPDFDYTDQSNISGDEDDYVDYLGFDDELTPFFGGEEEFLEPEDEFDFLALDKKTIPQVALPVYLNCAEEAQVALYVSEKKLSGVDDVEIWNVVDEQASSFLDSNLNHQYAEDILGGAPYRRFSDLSDFDVYKGIFEEKLSILRSDFFDGETADFVLNRVFHQATKSPLSSSVKSSIIEQYFPGDYQNFSGSLAHLELSNTLETYRSSREIQNYLVGTFLPIVRSLRPGRQRGRDRSD